MKTFLRKLRGVVSIGLTWGSLWGVLMALVGVGIGIFDPDSIDPGESVLVVGALMGLVGFVSGVLFGLLLAFAERRKTLRDLSLARVALWGALAAAVPPLLTGAAASMAFILCPLGAAFAAGSIALARRGEPRDEERLTAGSSELLPR